MQEAKPYLIIVAVVFGGILHSLVFSSSTLAAPVYKWEDSTGTVHYSSKPTGPKSKPADLPPIMRAEVKIPKGMLVSCKEHGGINCQAGADKDGSVICYDGFAGATARYRFSCNAPKLEITDISDPDRSGSFIVFVRNTTSVKASSPALIYKPDGGPEVKLEGPGEVEPFGLVEFNYKPEGEKMALVKANIGQLTVTCANCP